MIQSPHTSTHHTTGGAIVAAAVVLMGRDETRLAEFSSRVLDTGDGFGSVRGCVGVCECVWVGGWAGLAIHLLVKVLYNYILND